MKNHLKRLKKLAILLDYRYSFFGLKFGLDPILDIAPGIGSVIGALTSCYAFWVAFKLNVPVFIYLKMLFNILFDLIVGGIPVIGIVFDVFYKSNLKNINLLEKFVKKDFTNP